MTDALDFEPASLVRRDGSLVCRVHRQFDPTQTHSRATISRRTPAGQWLRPCPSALFATPTARVARWRMRRVSPPYAVRVPIGWPSSSARSMRQLSRAFSRPIRLASSFS